MHSNKSFNFARKKNLFITFMPKPMYHQAGNVMHLHLYLTKNGKNAFYKNIKHEQQENLLKKSALVEKAESLKDN